jgi:hypothetical protein
MQNRTKTALIATAALLWPMALPAVPPMVSQQQALGSIQCPPMIDGVRLERISNFTPPSGWQDDPMPSGGYASAELRVNSHYLTDNGNTMVCGYGASSGNTAYTLIRIVKSVPGNRTCSKGPNYSFSCKLKAPMLRR